MPPVEDHDLLRLIRANNIDDKDNGLNSWTCRRCSKKAASATPSATSSREPTLSSDDRKSLTSNAIADAVPTAEIHVKQEQVVCGYSQFNVSP